MEKVLMWEDEDLKNIKAQCFFNPTKHIFEILVSYKNYYESSTFPVSFNPTFGMDIIDQNQSLIIAEELALKIEKKIKGEVMKTALIIVDMQKDFCPGGALAVPQGDEIVKTINDLQLKSYDLIITTQDFHPKNHKSFASNNQGKKVGELGEINGQVQVMWPDHCVQGTDGVSFHPQLDLKKVNKNFTKGSNPEVDSYSGFFDNDKKSSTGLGEFLKEKNISKVDVVGLALDYCVKATALDAKNLGFDTTVILEATRAVNLSPDDGENAIVELKKAGVQIK